MYRLAICEDEPAIREDTGTLCAQILAGMGIENEIALFSGAEALEEAVFAGAAFDLLLLDIRLPGMDGLEFARRLRRHGSRVSIIFITSLTEYLPEGYGVQPIHFLLKPVSQEALAEAIRADWRLNHSPNAITLRAGGKTTVVQMNDIRYAESANHKILLHLSGEPLSFPMSITELERMLPQRLFCRCHNSFLVNIARIAQISRTRILLRSGEELPVGRSHYSAVHSALVRFLNAY